MTVRTTADRQCLEAFDPHTGAITRRRAAVGTQIVQLLPVGENVVVREDYYEFPRGASNVYCVNAQLETIWEAELPHPTDAYANPVVEDASALRCASWDGFTCDIDPQSGRLLKQSFTK